MSIFKYPPLIATFFLSICLWSNLFTEQSAITQLKTRQPNWRPKIIEAYADGKPKSVIFYLPADCQSVERPVQRQNFHPNGNLSCECDLITHDENILPHGPSVHYSAEGFITLIAFYSQGKLHGEIKSYYENGDIHTLANMQEGILHGLSEKYHANGQLAFKTTYVEGWLDGPFEKYGEKGHKQHLAFYRNGLIEGVTTEWYDTGEIKSKKNYMAGLLHENNSTAAVQLFYPDKKVMEIQNFIQNQPCGRHCKYHVNGNKSVEVTYLDGAKHGTKFHFDETGKILGKGDFLHGKAVGDHIYHYPNGKIRKEAHFTAEGTLCAPIKYYDESGILTKQVSKIGNLYEGSYSEWNKGILLKNYHYKTGEFDGQQQSFYPDGIIKNQTSYINGKRDGMQERWNSKGIKILEANFRQGILQGSFTTFHPNGDKKISCFYENGALQGLYQSFHQGGQLHENCWYQNGIKHGVNQKFDFRGKPILEAHFNAGILEGLLHEWFPNGNLKTKAFYSEGLLEGVYLSWHDTGSVHEEKNFSKGCEEGGQRIYFIQQELGKGILAKDLTYAHGKLDGVQQSFYASGQPKALMHYSDGLLEGKKTIWDETGEIVEEAIFSKNQLDGRYFVRHPSGKETIYHYKNGLLHGLHQIFYPLHPFFGKIKAFEATYSDDKLDGEALEFNEAGTMIASSMYSQGQKEGITAVYSANGCLHISAEFKNNQQNGPAYEYSPTGKVIKEAYFVDDLHDGSEKLFFENGKLAKLNNFKQGKLHGLCQTWTKEGVLTFDAEYQEGILHGKCNKFDNAGNPIVLQRYEQDKIIEKQKFKAEAELIEEN